MRFSTLRIAWRNLGRNRKRTGLALAAMAVGQLALLAMAGMMNGWKDEILDSIRGPALGDVQIDLREWRKERAIDLVLEDLSAKIELIRREPLVANAFARVYAPVLVAPAREAHMALVVGIDREAEGAERGLIEGLDAPLGGHHIMVGRIAAERFRVERGDRIAVIGQASDGAIANDLYTVSAIVMTQLDVVNRQGIVLSLEDAQELLAMEDQAHQIVVHGRDQERLAELAGALRAVPWSVAAGSELEVVTWEELVPQAVRMMEMLDYTTLFVLVFVFIAAVAGVANTMLMSTFERSHEIGMLLAMGAGPWRIVRMVVAEALALGLVGAAVGTALGCGFVWVFWYTGLDFAAMGGESVSDLAMHGMRMPLLVHPWLEVSDVLMGVGAIIVIAVLAAAWPAAIAARLHPVEAMRD